MNKSIIFNNIHVICFIWALTLIYVKFSFLVIIDDLISFTIDNIIYFRANCLMITWSRQSNDSSTNN